MTNATPTQQFDELVFRRLDQALLFDGSSFDKFLWVAGLTVVLLAGLAYVAWMYYRDSQSVRWYWAVGLALTRAAVYGIFAFIFLLPAVQTWERVEKHSRVLLLIDVSGSMHTSDAMPENDSTPLNQLPTRLDDVVKLLSDPEAKFLPRLLEKNPVAVYRFGARLDDEPLMLRADQPLPTAAEWRAWLNYDLKAWLLAGLSPEGQAALQATPAFTDNKRGDYEWAAAWLARDAKETVPAGLSDVDRAALMAKRARLGKRGDAARELPRGTDIGKSLQALLDHESANILAGVFLFSDGRSNSSAADASADLRARAHRDGVPLVTVGIGTDRPPVQLRITDVQVPDQTVPDEPFPVRVGLDGVGLAGTEVTVSLDLTRPGADTPSHTLTTKVTFPNETAVVPHVDAEFTVSPDNLPAEFLAEAKDAAKPPPGQQPKKGLVVGTWKVTARAPKMKGERLAEREHAYDPQPVQVLRKKLKVLLFAGGPSHDYQFVRTLMAREVSEHRAELSVCLQNDAARQKDEAPDDEAAARVEVAQDVDESRFLPRFPTKFQDTPPPAGKPLPPARGQKTESPYMNLARYDVIIAFDPDWSKLSLDQMQMLDRWVRAGGGLVFVAGPVHSFQIKRRLLSEESLKVLQTLYPVRPGDSVVSGPGSGHGAREPQRLHFLTNDPDLSFLKLDESSPDPQAGWTDFFRTGPDGKPMHGFYNPYPVEGLTPGARVVATFAGDQSRRGEQEMPYLVTLDVGDGRTAFLGSAETYRLRQFHEVFFDRFWLKLSRWTAVASLKKKSRRGTLVLARKYPADSVVTVKAKLFDAGANPLPPSTVVKGVLYPKGAEKDKAQHKEFMLKGDPPAPGRSGQPPQPTGWFQGRILVETPGTYSLKVTVPDSGEDLPGEFAVEAANRELENTRPDFTALYQLAGDLADAEKAVTEKALVARLRDAAARGRAMAAPSAGQEAAAGGPTARLFFDPAGSALVPDFLKDIPSQQNNKVGVRDVWDRGPTIQAGRFGPVKLPWLLWAVVGLLAVEWLTRKLLRLA